MKDEGHVKKLPPEDWVDWGTDEIVRGTPPVGGIIIGTIGICCAVIAIIFLIGML